MEDKSSGNRKGMKWLKRNVAPMGLSARHYWELVVSLQWVSLIRCQFHLPRNRDALPVRFHGAFSRASNIDTVNMKGIGHCTILGILDLKHLF